MTDSAARFRDVLLDALAIGVGWLVAAAVLVGSVVGLIYGVTGRV